MLKIIPAIIDSIFPPRDTERLVNEINSRDIIEYFSPGRYENIHFLASYKDKNIQAHIKENKYQQNTKAAKQLAVLLEQWLGGRADNIILIPIPLGAKRKKERGYNQVSEILHYVSLPENTTIRGDILVRAKETPTQTNLSKTERQSNLKNAFSCGAEKLPELENYTLVLVDDVVTTGATLEAARSVLTARLSLSNKVICLAIAH